MEKASLELGIFTSFLVRFSSLFRCVRIFVLLLLIGGCTSKQILKEEEGAFQDIREEYEKHVQIKEVRPVKSKKSQKIEVTKNVEDAKKSPVIKEVKPEKPPVSSKRKMAKHLPSLEDSEGFDGRRPLEDPFRPGESVTLSIKYINMRAGDATLEVGDFVEVNGQRSYKLSAKVESNSRFAFVYKVSNFAETYLDFKNMVPHTLSIDNNESSRLVESKTFFDWTKHQATLWEKKVEKDEKPKKKHIEWKINPYTQNIISALFYIRAFTLKPGKELSFRVSDDGKNYIFKGKVLREEKLKTALGEIETVVLQPEFQLDGVLKPSGKNYIWLTNDNRKLIVRIESKVKIGTLIGELKSWNLGD